MAFKMKYNRSGFPFKQPGVTEPTGTPPKEAVANADNIQLSGDLYETTVDGVTHYKTTGEDNADIEKYAGSEEEKESLKARQMANIRNVSK
tara:strand:- start:31 stop:303 length:273 start_codon:yes stop_codon:yes gene_type:complete